MSIPMKYLYFVFLITIAIRGAKVEKCSIEAMMILSEVFTSDSGINHSSSSLS